MYKTALSFYHILKIKVEYEFHLLHILLFCLSLFTMFIIADKCITKLALPKTTNTYMLIDWGIVLFVPVS